MIALSIQKTLEEHEDSDCQCDNCGHRCRGRDLDAISDIGNRLDPGATVPAGECPKCGCLSYLIKPGTWNATFREVTRKRVGGGPKATGADEITFMGDVGSGPIIITSRVRLIDPSESFRTCSAHRLRDSKVGEAGHWVDIKVPRSCSDADIKKIEALAADIDIRPIQVRRR